MPKLIEGGARAILSLVLSGLFVFSFFADVHATEPEVQDSTVDGLDLSAADVLEKVAKTYRESNSYMDRGTTTTTYTSEDGKEKQLRYEFRTAFERNGRFRFAYRKNLFGRGFGEATILWHDGKESLVSWYDPNNFVAEENLGLAVAGLTGVSSGTAHTVPALLMPKEVGGRLIVELTPNQPMAVEEVEGKLCYKIQGTFGRGDSGSTIVWIDKSSFTLLKMEESDVMPGKASLRTTAYSPIMNEKILDRLFEKNVDGEWQSK